MDPNLTTQPAPQQTLPKAASGTNKYLQPYKSRRAIMFDNFLGGLFWSLGTFLGLAILTVIAGYFISKIDLVPIIGKWMAKILQNATTQIQPPVPIQ